MSAVAGVVAPGFGRVRDEFERLLAEVGQGGAAFAAARDGELLVDLWAGQDGNRPWTAETRAVLMSTTKSIATIAVARLVDRGLLSVGRRVAEYWPAFGQAGKEKITVAQLLDHSAGLITVPGYADLLHPDGTGWGDTDEIIRRLEAAAPLWPPGSAHGYHGLTFGWLIGQLVLCASGKPIGEVVRQELAIPMGLELDLGTPPGRQGLVASVRQPPATSRSTDVGPAGPLLEKMLLAVDGRSILDEDAAFFNAPAILALELAGSNATATARAVALLHAAAASPGLLASSTLTTFTAERARGIDRVLAERSRRALGFELQLPLADVPSAYWMGPSHGAFGHNGHGGQLGIADPERRLGIGFVRSELSATSPLGPRLVAALYDEIDRGVGAQA